MSDKLEKTSFRKGPKIRKTISKVLRLDNGPPSKSKEERERPDSPENG